MNIKPAPGQTWRNAAGEERRITTVCTSNAVGTDWEVHYRDPEFHIAASVAWLRWAADAVLVKPTAGEKA